jgi:uncharacterized protein YxjI
MRQRIVSIGDDFWIEDGCNAKVFKIQEGMLRIKDSIEVDGPTGETLATAKKAIISPVRDRFTVSICGGEVLEIHNSGHDKERLAKGV